MPTGPEVPYELRLSSLAAAHSSRHGNRVDALAYIAAALLAVWGALHVVPTRRVVAGFAAISADNRRVLIQEWLAEAFTMWGTTALIIRVTAAEGGANIRDYVYRVLAGLLIALAVLTGATGARTHVLWFKACPIVLGGSAGLLLIASAL